MLYTIYIQKLPIICIIQCILVVFFGNKTLLLNNTLGSIMQVANELYFLNRNEEKPYQHSLKHLQKYGKPTFDLPSHISMLYNSTYSLFYMGVYLYYMMIALGD